MLHPEMTADLATHLAAEGSEGVPARSYRRDGVHGRLVHDLGRRIVSGEFAPGDLLPTETALVSELGSGRSAVREAVKVLTAKGLVRTRTKTGTVVLPEATWNLLDPDVLAWRYQTAPTGQQLDDLAGLRVALEPEAARLAARARGKAATEPIKAAYQRMAETVGDPDTFHRARPGFPPGHRGRGRQPAAGPAIRPAAHRAGRRPAGAHP